MRIVAPCFFSFSQPKLIMLQLRQPSTLSINSINDVDSVVHIMQEDHFTLSNAHVMNTHAIRLCHHYVDIGFMT